MSYQNSSSARDAQFQNLVQNIGSNIQRIQQNATTIKVMTKCQHEFRLKVYLQKLTSQIGSSVRHHGAQLQQQLHQLNQLTGQLARDSGEQLHQLSSFLEDGAGDCRRWRLQRDTLQGEFKKALGSFQVAQREAAEKERENIRY